MKKFGIITALVAIISIFAAAAFAGSVYDRATKALSVTTGGGTWTNTNPYAAILLKRIWIQNALETNGTYTITRGGSGYSDAVGSVVMGATTNNSTASFTASYLKYGDTLVFVNTVVSTGATAVIEYEVQQH